MRGPATSLGRDADTLVRSVAAAGDDVILADLADRFGRERVMAAHARAGAQVEIDAVVELGDPTPVRLT